MLTSRSSTSVQIDGVTITASIPLYLFMYPALDPLLVVDAVLACNDESGSARIKTNIPVSRATIVDVSNALLTTKLCKCECGNTAFHTSMDTNRNGQCESCFIRDLKEECNKITEAATKEQLTTDKRMYAQGYRFRIDAWIHPIAGGDDYTLVMYSYANPSKDSIVKKLKREKSVRTNDYRVTELVNCI